MHLAEIGKVLGSASRVKMLAALMGGKALPASELAYRARISSASASEHLSLLERSGLVTVRRCGRHRYYELKSEDIGRMLEEVAGISPELGKENFSAVPQGLRKARFCYDHLAGENGVKVTDGLVNRGVIAPSGKDYVLCSETPQPLLALGLDLRAVRHTKRHFARQCIDWSERRPHVAGALGAAITSRMLELGWIARSRDDRSAQITDAGRAGLKEWLNLEC
jgi:DNA-binding transcriptional ArsR family regulator